MIGLTFISQYLCNLYKGVYGDCIHFCQKLKIQMAFNLQMDIHSEILLSNKMSKLLVFETTG